jgi:hypothetical protein
MEEAILQIRGGNRFTNLFTIMAFVIFVNWFDETNAFQRAIPPHLNPMLYFQHSYQPKTISPSKSPTSFQNTRPVAMPHQDFTGLTKEEIYLTREIDLLMLKVTLSLL